MQRPAVLYFAKSAISPQQVQGLLTENLMRYTDAANASMLNLLDSHDTARFVTVCGGDTARLKNAAAFLFTFVGMPCTYYGTETGMTGENDPDCRKAFDWEQMFALAIDHDKPRAYFESKPPADRHSCSMCGKMCAMKTVNDLMDGLVPDLDAA